MIGRDFGPEPRTDPHVAVPSRCRVPGTEGPISLPILIFTVLARQATSRADTYVLRQSRKHCVRHVRTARGGYIRSVSGIPGSVRRWMSTLAEERTSAWMASVTSQTFTFIPATTLPSDSQNAMNSRPDRSPR